MKKEIKAILLSAGYGLRLKPITDNLPKCLVKINNEPLLGRWLAELHKIGCKKTLINTHYLASKVESFVDKLNYKDMQIELSHEDKLLGTAGTLLKNLNFLKGSIGILMHVDNVTNFNLQELLIAHEKRKKNCILTLLSFNCTNPKSAGILEKDKDGIMINFHEKVENPPSTCANGAIYIFEDEFINWISELKNKPKDFSQDVLPLLLNKVQTYHTDKVYLDIGTPTSLAAAEKIFK